MNVNVKLSISDEDRNLMSRRLTGKDSKKMVSRAEVNNWVKDQLEKFLRLGSPATAQIETAREDEEFEELKRKDELYDLGTGELIEALQEAEKQNKLLLTRNNVLQHRLDTTR